MISIAKHAVAAGRYAPGLSATTLSFLSRMVPWPRESAATLMADAMPPRAQLLSNGMGHERPGPLMMRPRCVHSLVRCRLVRCYAIMSRAMLAANCNFQECVF